MNIKGIKAPFVKSEARTPAGDHVVLQPTSKSRCFRCLDVLVCVENTQQLHKCSQTVDCTSGKEKKRRKEIKGQRKSEH